MKVTSYLKSTSIFILLNIFFFACQKKGSNLIIAERDTWEIMNIDGGNDFDAVIDTNSIKIKSSTLSKGEHILNLKSKYGDSTKIIVKIERDSTIINLSEVTKHYYKEIFLSSESLQSPMDTMTSIIRNDFKNENKLFVEEIHFGCFSGSTKIKMYENFSDSIKVTSISSNEEKFLIDSYCFLPKEYIDSLINFELSLYKNSRDTCRSTSGYRYKIKLGKKVIHSRRYGFCIEKPFISDQLSSKRNYHQ